MARHADEQGRASVIDESVAYAWTGLGASFGPALLLSWWWRGTTRWGVLAGMLGGTIATVVWKNSERLADLLDLKAAPVLISAALVVLVSLADRRRASRETAAG